ncbi:MAG: sensor histidine kinase [Sphingobacteriaceae bacterium]
MSKQNKIYWICQFGGWLFYILVNLIFFGLTSQTTYKDYLLYILMIPSGILITHSYRFFIYIFNALNFKLYYQIIIILVGSLAKAILIFFVLALLSMIFNLSGRELSFVNVFSSIINFSVVFFLWNTIYFGYHYFINYKRAEINNLRLEAAGKESELNSLKAQLNPHFMFNSMNSIRALIDEDPQKAKQAVTQLSNILRNSLLMNKNKEISIEEEINLVKDYLDLEKIRYEERLSFDISIDPKTLHLMVPPLIIQGQVENAIKHGISKLPSGGKVTITSQLRESILQIQITNTGKLNTEKSVTGLGFNNSLQRLQLMYGKHAQIKIEEDQANQTVISTIQIPIKNYK